MASDLMNADLYKPNSHKSKKEQRDKPKATPVVKGTVTSKETSMVKRTARNVLAEDMNNVKSYIILDVLIPTIKDAIVNIVSNGINMLVYGDSVPVKNGTRYNYNGITNRKNNSITPKAMAAERRVSHDFRDIEYETRGDALEVLSRMNEYIEDYGSCTVEDFYQFSKQSKYAKFTDRNWGWTQLGNIDIIRLRGGRFSLNLPRAERLEK